LSDLDDDPFLYKFNCVWLADLQNVVFAVELLKVQQESLVERESHRGVTREG